MLILIENIIAVVLGLPLLFIGFISIVFFPFAIFGGALKESNIDVYYEDNYDN